LGCGRGRTAGTQLAPEGRVLSGPGHRRFANDFSWSPGGTSSESRSAGTGYSLLNPFSLSGRTRL
jgi:hypothetical protein